jgi:hypothetical protein
MDVFLRFDDLYTLQQNLQWEFRNAEREISINDLKKIILDSFSQAADTLHLRDILPFPDCSIMIGLLVRGRQKNPMLAYFDLNNLTDQSREFSFKIYADVLFPLLRSGDMRLLNSIWIHEIMHLIDYRELLKNLKIYKEKIQVVSSDSSSSSYQHIRNDKHIILLSLMMHFRAEGIATLTEFVMGGYMPDLLPPHLAKEKFYEIISAAISLIYTSDFDSRHLAEFLAVVSPYAYQIGAGNVLNGLMKKHPEFIRFSEIENCLVNMCSCDYAHDDQLIQKIRMFDSFNFIEYSLDQGWLCDNVRELTASYTNSLNFYGGFFKFLNRIRKNNDPEGFISLLSYILVTPLTLSQMEEEYSQKCSDPNVPAEIIESLNRIFQHLRQNPGNDVCRWALTYTFINQDLLDDTIEYFGYMDDMEVLKTALQFIHD